MGSPWCFSHLVIPWLSHPKGFPAARQRAGHEQRQSLAAIHGPEKKSLRRGFSELQRKQKVHRALVLRKRKSGPLRIQSSPKGMTGRQMKAGAQAEGKSGLGKEEIKILFPFGQPHQLLLPTGWKSAELRGGNGKVSYQGRHKGLSPLPG